MGLGGNFGGCEVSGGDPKTHRVGGEEGCREGESCHNDSTPNGMGGGVESCQDDSTTN